jgi:hypothetical protein
MTYATRVEEWCQRHRGERRACLFLSEKCCLGPALIVVVHFIQSHPTDVFLAINIARRKAWINVACSQALSSRTIVAIPSPRGCFISVDRKRNDFVEALLEEKTIFCLGAYQYARGNYQD